MILGDCIVVIVDQHKNILHEIQNPMIIPQIGDKIGWWDRKQSTTEPRTVQNITIFYPPDLTNGDKIIAEVLVYSNY